MPISKEHADKIRAGIAAAYKELGRDFYAKNGAKGGRNGTGHKFAHGKVDPAEARKMRFKK